MNNVSTPADGSIEATLNERGKRYGIFAEQAAIAQAIKDAMRMGQFEQLRPDMKECLDMIANKAARILNGDPFYHDSWHDIIGYTKLVADTLTEEHQKMEEQIDQLELPFGTVRSTDYPVVERGLHCLQEDVRPETGWERCLFEDGGMARHSEPCVVSYGYPAERGVYGLREGQASALHAVTQRHGSGAFPMAVRHGDSISFGIIVPSELRFHDNQ